MERNMSIQRTTDNGCSCNGCGARNYVSMTTAPEEKLVDTIYEVRVGIMCIRLCPDCLAVLAKQATVVLDGEG